MKNPLMFSLFAGLVLLASPALAEKTPNAGALDSRIRYVNYDADQVVRINGVFRAASQIVFSPGEAITSVALGDTISWEVAPAENILFIKPKERAGPTNLIVVTRKGAATRTYTFALTARAGAISADTNVQFVIRFRYPADAQAVKRDAIMRDLQVQMYVVEAGGVAIALEAGAIEGQRNLQYRLSGPADLAPSEISDNGRFTILRFPRNQPVPAIFTILPDGSEALVPYDVRGEFIVIHQVSRQFRLRRGAAMVCIWNDAFDRLGPDNSSGTVSPQVERKTEGEQ